MRAHSAPGTGAAKAQVDEDGSESRWTFEELLEEASNCVATDIFGIEDLLRRCHEAGLLDGRVSVIEKAIDDATELGAAVIAKLRRDQKEMVGDRHVGSVEDAARAAVDQLEGFVVDAVFDEGGVYAYQLAEDAERPKPDELCYSLVTDEDLDTFLLDSPLGAVPLVQNPSRRKQIIARLKVALTKKGYLAGGRPGLNCTNGFAAYDAQQQRVVLLPHDPEHRARFLAPVAYDRSAEAPTFVAGLERVLPDEPSRQAFLEFLGATLFGVLPEKENVRRMLVLHGATRSGKSTLIEMFQMLFPPHAVASVAPEDWSSEFERARLAGVHLNVCTELTGGKLP